jgi:hypothetical protein
VAAALNGCPPEVRALVHMAVSGAGGRRVVCSAAESESARLRLAECLECWTAEAAAVRESARGAA